MIPRLVTTIIPVRNRPTMLREAVESVLAQTYRPIEILIVDDGSTDRTPAVADGLARDHEEIRSLHRLRGGPGAARETGRTCARGEFIQYLDSDDLLEPHKFELQVEGLLTHPECGASYGWTRLRRPDGTAAETPLKRTGERIETMFPAFLQSRWWDTSTPLFRRAVVDAVGPWLDLRVEEDWEYDARAAALGTRLHYCEAWVSETRQIDPGRASTHSGPEVMRQRAHAHSEIYWHARRAGVSDSSPEMQHFSKELFLLSRQAGELGLDLESSALFSLAREAAGPASNRLAFQLYSFGARLLGWSGAARVAAVLERVR